MEYKYRTTEDLINTYAWINESAVASDKDKENAKSLIKSELEKRFSAVIELLDDSQTTENPAGTFRYLLGL